MGLFTDAIDWLEELGKKAGVSVKPNTPVSVLYPYLDKIDMILVMTVEPGFGGQGFITEQKITCKSTCSYCSKPLAYPQIKPAEHQLPDHGRNSLLERHRKVQRLENAAEHPYPAYTNT